MRLTCDFHVNESYPARLTTAIYRGGRGALLRRSPTLILWKMADLIWSRCIVGAELPFTFQAGPGLRLPHWGRGVILGRNVIVGSNVTLYHRVTIGWGAEQKDPRLGDNVYVGVGATILGGCFVGDGAKVGTNAVVTKDVPAGKTVIGANRVVQKVDGASAAPQVV